MSLSQTRALVQTRDGALEWAARHHPAELEAGARHFLQGQPSPGEYLTRMALDFALQCPHACPPEPGRDSLLQRYAETRPPLPSTGRRILAALLEARLRVLEVTAVSPGTFFVGRDVMTGECTRYAERSASEGLEVGAWLYAITLTTSEGTVLEGVARGLQPGARLQVVLALRAALAAQGVSDPARATARQTRAAAWAVVEAHEKASRRPNYVTVDGHPVAPRTVRLRVPAAALVEVLKGWPDAQEDDGEWAVLSAQRHPDLGGPVVLASIRLLGGGRVSVFVQTPARWETLRGRLEQALGPALVVTGIDPVPVDSDPDGPLIMMDSARVELAEGQDPQAHLAVFVADRDRLWVDQPLEALGGRTPRQAVGEGLQAEVRAMLGAREGDGAALRAALGL